MIFSIVPVAHCLELKLPLKNHAQFMDMVSLVFGVQRDRTLMHSADVTRSEMFYQMLEERIPASHPPRKLRVLVGSVLVTLDAING